MILLLWSLMSIQVEHAKARKINIKWDKIVVHVTITAKKVTNDVLFIVGIRSRIASFGRLLTQAVIPIMTKKKRQPLTEVEYRYIFQFSKLILFPNENAPRCATNFSLWLTGMECSVAALR